MAMTPSGLTITLRKQTLALHRAVKALPLPRRVMSASVTKTDYAEYLAAIHRVYALMESALFDHIPPQLLAALGVRPKLPALEADLADLGAEPLRPLGRAAAALRLPRPGDLAGSVGALYVLERATLGGRVVARHLRRKLPDQGAGVPFRFLEFHGAEVAGAWRRFAITLDALKTRPDFPAGRLIEGAQVAFESVLGILRHDDTRTRPGIAAAFALGRI